MTDPDPLGSRTIVIAGLGLMGGSLALALRGRCRRILAVDPDPGTRRLALANGVVDEIEAEPAGLLPKADLIVLAAPVRACLDLLDRLPDLHPASPVVMDLASTKGEITAGYRRLPERFDPLPAHPMCGKENGGLEHAEAGLFEGAVFVFTRLPRTSPTARRLGEQIAAAVGATPLWLSPEDHDARVARTSHVPYLLAAALTAATPAAAAPLIGPGFRSAARLAGSDPAMIGGVLLTNREEIGSALADLRAELEALAALVAGGDETALLAALAAVSRKYGSLLEAAGPGRPA